MSVGKPLTMPLFFDAVFGNGADTSGGCGVIFGSFVFGVAVGGSTSDPVVGVACGNGPTVGAVEAADPPLPDVPPPCCVDPGAVVAGTAAAPGASPALSSAETVIAPAATNTMTMPMTIFIAGVNVDVFSPVIGYAPSGSSCSPCHE